ncbi:Hpt domain-containing protein, partial [Pacificitalea manganoxidans]
IQARAHALAGICGMFGIERLHIRLKAIETACKAGDRGAAQAQMPPLAAAWEEARAAWHARLG